MNVYRAEWSGCYPCLCQGEWTLFINDEPCEIEIPFQNNWADTFGLYEEWWFGEDWNVITGHFEDGMLCDDWCNKYQDYLKKVAPKSDWPDIYEAFQLNDWRNGSCGGCI